MKEQIKLSERQIETLARPLVKIITKFYEDPKNEEKFQRWLQEKEDKE